VQLTFTSTYFGNKHCSTHKDSRTSRWKCDRPLKRTIGGEGLAQIIITEYPWEGVPIQRDCLCTNRSEPLNIHTLTASVIEVNFTVTMMNITEDYDDFAFEGEYKFVPTGSGDETVCSTGWVTGNSEVVVGKFDFMTKDIRLSRQRLLVIEM
jgi:hypothetical protein